ncbi:hypothetical protein KO527_12155 [Pseudoalteromonas sp. C2R02]|uniref:hypothetical protein n=1 Tax=Pseudoalteromonas sp. C2R02 TaxID=2841565 RepID=UPI001C084811|nr:hypothetical protein [Pseudoalteromonas sp. C2R02]MBU2970106.1 hypothetical protein [Pseudoalteromonas sp. C2R02]
MKKIITVASAAGFTLLSFAATAGYWDFAIYNYVDDSGKVVGTYYRPCFERPGVLQGERTNKKVLVETGTCR